MTLVFIASIYQNTPAPSTFRGERMPQIQIPDSRMPELLKESYAYIQRRIDKFGKGKEWFVAHKYVEEKPFGLGMKY